MIAYEWKTFGMHMVVSSDQLGTSVGDYPLEVEPMSSITKKCMILCKQNDLCNNFVIRGDPYNICKMYNGRISELTTHELDRNYGTSFYKSWHLKTKK